jgi:outer membrane protein assembly factor BamB
MKYRFILALIFIFPMVNGQTAQWRGPDRNGVFPDTALLDVWPEEGPPLAFMVEGLGRSYSSVIATDHHFYVTGTQDSTEYLFCIDMDGRVLWKKPYGRSWDASFPDARCTPLLDEDRVYVLSGKDDLACLHAQTGEMIWSTNLREEYGSVWDMFGVSESLLLVDDKLICTPGGNETTVIALDKYTGDLVWKSASLETERSNGSPILFENDSMGITQIIAMNRTHVLGVDPGTGEIYWTYHYNKLNEKGENVTILANSPLYYGNEILISDGWDQPTVMLELSSDGKTVREKYLDNTLDNQNHGLVKIGDFVYGSNFLTRNFGKWVCMRWSNGEIMWVEEWENKGPVIAADGMLYLMDEKKGNVALVRPDPSGLEIVSTFMIKEGRGPFWARPAIYNGHLFIRHGDVLLAYDIRNYSSL